VAQADIILSIVPPRDAVATARRAVVASRSPNAIRQRRERTAGGQLGHAPTSLTYIDLNAISPRTATTIATLINAEHSPPRPAGVSRPRRLSLSKAFSFHQSESEVNSDAELEPVEPIPINFLDGGIIGGPPTLHHDQTWKRPSLVISGPRHADLLPPSFLSLLNAKVIADTIGPASALKSCFASLTKGLTALSILSFTTAHTCGILPELQAHLEEFSPDTLALVQRGLTGMPPKAYRWVDEMRQIGETFADEGGFNHALLEEGAGPADSSHHDDHVGIGHAVFDGIADLYQFVADHTVLGEERAEHRKRGLDPEDVAECVKAGIAVKKQKDAVSEGQILEHAWRERWS